MRKLMAMFAICVVAASTPSWALLGMGDIKFDGSLEVSGASANNETDFGNDPAGATTSNDHRGVTATRVRLGMDAKITDGVGARLELARNPGSAGSAALYGGAAKPTSVSGEEGVWLFHNAYAQLDDLWGFNVRLGRQYTGDKGDLVWHIGPKSDDAMTITSIDGLLFKCPDQKNTGTWMDKVHLNLFTGKQTEAATSVAQTDATNSGDVNLTDLEAKIGLMPELNIRVAYLIGKAANTQVESDNNTLDIYRLGVNGGISENMLTYRAEFLGNTGQQNRAAALGNLKYKGTAFDLGLGFNSKETAMGGFGAWANYVWASGDKDTTDTSDKSFHDFSTLGVNTSDRYFGEIFGKSNALGGAAGAANGAPVGQGLDSGVQGTGINVFNIGAKWTPTFVKKTSLRLDYYMFSRSEHNVTTAPGTTTDLKSKFGDEFDAAIAYDHSENVNLEFGAAMMKPDDALLVSAGFPTTGKSDSISKLYARATIKWGGEDK